VKILRIKFKNLNSLRGDHELNFEAAPLAGSGLFAITGPTGAGKSTVLDAITLGLYGKAARYRDVPSPEDMMSRHCGECAAEVVFQVPAGTFRAEWQLHRARTKADGNLQPAKRYLYDSLNKPLTQKVGETEELIERLIGLDYSRFLRSALLAQGEFAQFLKAKPDERAELLESLTGTEIYSELGALAHAETGRREDEFDAKEAGIRQIQLLPEEQRQRILEELPKTEEKLKRLKEEIEQNTGLLNKATNLDNAIKGEAAALAKQTDLRARIKAAEEEIKRLAIHRQTMPFNAKLADLDAIEKAVGATGTLLARATDERHQVITRARHCLAGLRQLIGSEMEKNAVATRTCGTNLEKAVQQKTAAEKWLIQHEPEKQLFERLADTISKLAALKSARRELEREWGQLLLLAKRLQPEGSNLKERPDELTTAMLKQILIGLEEAGNTRHNAAATANTDAETELKLREDHLVSAKLVANFEQHRGSLKKNEPCPLCGATEHPFAEGMKPLFPFKELEALIQKARKVFESRQKELDDLKRSRNELKQNGERMQQAVDELAENMVRVADALAPLSLTVPTPGNEHETSAALQKRADGYRETMAAQEHAERNRIAAEAEQKSLHRVRTELEGKRTDYASESVPDLGGFGSDATSMDWPSVASAEKNWLQVKSDLTAVTVTVTNRESDKKRLALDLVNAETELSAALAGSNFKNIAELKAARLEPIVASRLEAVENDLDVRGREIKAELRTASQSIERLRSEGAPEGDALTSLKQRRSLLQNEHDDLIRKLNTWTNQLAQDDANRKAIAARQKELEASRATLEIWRRLRGLIGSHDGRTFRRYAQALSLDVLVRYANRHLARLSDRYRLRRRNGEDLDLEIEDFHQAGAVRPMASLSGGESFLASLALALGLSDLAGRNVRIDSLFIDEGLSSLDSETLDLAISALETLRQDVKTVGVISHVDLLKERIATQIVVEKLSGGVSSLRTVCR
jgi:exonuclease SbcC